MTSQSKIYGEAGRDARPLLILASTSPRRRDLLSEHGYTFEVVSPVDVEEIATPGLSPGEIVLQNARAKAHSVSKLHPDALVIGVDTEVFFEGGVLGKPADMETAFQMISRLNGRTHEVHSGVCLVHGASRKSHEFVEITRVHFHSRNDEELRAYLERIHPLDKAGAYAAQNDNGAMISRFEGSFSNVIGLPMEALAAALAAF